MRHKISLFETRDRTDYCDEDSEPKKVHEARCAIVPLSGQELLTAQAIDHTIQYRIEMRFPRKLITTKNHAIWRRKNLPDTRFNIRAALDVSGRNRELHLLCAVAE